jgi:exodeoxyribonuclease-3
MRIATWNLNGLSARLAFLRRWLAERAPDVVALQEIKMLDEQLPQLDFAAAGYHIVTHGQKAWNGVAVLSRSPIATVERGLPGQEELGARLISAQVGDIRLLNAYCPNGKHVGHDDFPRKLAWFDTLAEHLEHHHDRGEPLILCGDFNVCPAAIDSWNEAEFAGQIFHTLEERSRFQRLLAWGLVDVFRARHPDLQAFSWWDYRGGAFHRKQGLRIDFILATQSVAERVRQVAIDRDYRKKQDGLQPSDHAPVLADIE